MPSTLLSKSPKVPPWKLAQIVAGFFISKELMTTVLTFLRASVFLCYNIAQSQLQVEKDRLKELHGMCDSFIDPIRPKLVHNALYKFNQPLSCLLFLFLMICNKDEWTALTGKTEACQLSIDGYNSNNMQQVNVCNFINTYVLYYYYPLVCLNRMNENHRKVQLRTNALKEQIMQLREERSRAKYICIYTLHNVDSNLCN